MIPCFQTYNLDMSICWSMKRLGERLKPHQGQPRGLVSVDKTGHVTVDGQVRDGAGFGNRLRFSLPFDQTLLRSTLLVLDKAQVEIRKNKA